MRTVTTSFSAVLLVVSLASCGSKNGGDDDDDGPDACVGRECDVVDCDAMGKAPTTITGTVFAPNGTLPLYGINVYVPRSDPGPLIDGVTCDRCSTELLGGPVSKTTTDEAGNFTLENVPPGANIPLVMQSGKWRKQITISNVPQCEQTTAPMTETRMPADRSEGDIPKIAITTGDADALECLIRKFGIKDSEIAVDGDARIHLYNGNGANTIGATPMRNATTLWDSLDNMKAYDILIFSCEGEQGAERKSQDAMNNVKAYADIGGRVFMSHWHNIWIEGSTQDNDFDQAPPVWTQIAQWNNSGTTFTNPPDTIDEINNPGKGPAFATWMLNVMGSPAGQRGVIPIGASTGKQTCTGVTPGRAERWVYWENNGVEYPQNFQFTTPNEAMPGDRCGKVVFSDMHVSGDSNSTAGQPFPSQCSNDELTSQEKALAFMLFDIASCISVIF
ncbi:MAG: carboxypeptidase-like regulatory domain-containing protein [Kofleriaceae bacterium]